MNRVIFFGILCFVFFDVVLASADNGLESKTEADSKNPPNNSTDIDPNKLILDEVSVPKIYSKSEIQANCKKYGQKYISYAAQLYFVDQCKLRMIERPEYAYELTRKKVKIVEVDADVIASIPQGDAIVTTDGKKVRTRSCKELNNQYVSFSFTDIYFVKNCTKKMFPDYETYVIHRKKTKAERNKPIEGLTWEEFSNIPAAVPFDTIIDGEFAKLLSGKANIDVIPIDEACRGLEGKIASFHSKVYKIEKCKKRELDIENYMLKRKGIVGHFVEMKAEQWLSMPDGIPVPSERKKEQPNVIKRKI